VRFLGADDDGAEHGSDRDRGDCGKAEKNRKRTLYSRREAVA